MKYRRACINIHAIDKFVTLRDWTAARTFSLMIIQVIG